MQDKIKSFSIVFFTFLLLFIAVVIGSAAVYTYLEFGIVPIDRFLAVLDDVFEIEWAVNRIYIFFSFSNILLFIMKNNLF